MGGTIRLRGLPLGGGAPKIAVPLTGGDWQALRQQALEAAGADLIEWRADHYTGENSELVQTLARLREIVGEMPLLFTHRSVAEGGEGALGDEDYLALYRDVIASKNADLVDIELGRGDTLCQALIAQAGRAGIPTVLSGHNFKTTPPAANMLGTLRRMKALGADLPKIAVWPHNAGDVLALFTACEAFSREDGPLIAISMGKLGQVSRVAAGLFGSAITFGAVGEGSAPGQIEAAELGRMLETLY